MSRIKKKHCKKLKEDEETSVFLLLLDVTEALVRLLLIFWAVYYIVMCNLAFIGTVKLNEHQLASIANEEYSAFSYLTKFIYPTKIISEIQKYKQKAFILNQQAKAGVNVNKVKIKNIIGDFGEKVIATRPEKKKKENLLPPQDMDVVLPVINDENSHDKKLIIKNRNIVKQKIELVLGEEGGQQSIDNARAILHSKLQKLRNKIDSKHCLLCDN